MKIDFKQIKIMVVTKKLGLWSKLKIREQEIEMV